MNDINECKNYIKKLASEFIDNQKRQQERDALIGENHIEKRDIKGYHGREILELLQNADDAYQKSVNNGEKPKEDLEVEITYKNNTLTIKNTGTFFDNDGIKAIVQGNNSPKKGKYIGNKGTGFRSVLNWAKTVRILSGYFNVVFSKAIAHKIFEEIKNEPQIQKQLKKEPNLYIPMLAVPENIENGSFNKSTKIEIEIDMERINDDYSVTKQLNGIDLRILLFLPNISQIHIITDENDILYKRDVHSVENTDIGEMKNVVLQKIIAGNLDVEEKFYVFKKEIPQAVNEDGVLKDILLSIAIPEDFSTFKRKHIYSFFPLLDTESPFDCVLHASYDLGDNRNTIRKNTNNKKILEKQLSFIVEVATHFVKKGNFDVAYKLLVPAHFSNSSWSFPPSFGQIGLEDFYCNLLVKQKVFQTVNGENLSIQDEPKILGDDFPNVFAGEKFKNLLKPLHDDRMFGFLSFLAGKAGIETGFSEKDIAELINSLTHNWSVSQQTDVFIWWNNKFKYGNLLPKLLKNQENKWLDFQQECYFLVGDTDDMILPKWVKIPALKKEYQQELFAKAENLQEVQTIRQTDKDINISRIIAQNNLFSAINFKYRDRNNIITTVNSSVENNYANAVGFIQWLWENYHEDSDWNPPGQSGDSKFKYNFPCAKTKTVVDSEKLFFGSEYENDLAEKLFDTEFGNFPPVSEFSFSDEGKKDFKNFISKFGVKDFPKIKVQNIITPIPSYKSEYESIINADKKTYIGGSEYIYSINFNLPYISNLEKLLEELSTKQIINWIVNDRNLHSTLSLKDLFKEGSIIYQGNRQVNSRYFPGTIKNYILEVFNESRWIEIDGNRYSPRETLLSFKNKNNVKFSKLVPVLSIEKIELIANELKISFEEVQNILSKFDFCEKVTDLKSDDFYGLLLNLQNMEISNSDTIELSKIIYRIIEQSDFSKTFSDSEKQQTFFREGKVLVKYKGKLQYYLVTESVLPSSKIINKKNVPIVEKGPRTNNDNFKRIFGCKEYDGEYSVDTDSAVISPANETFQIYFSEFKKYARAYGERNDNIERSGSNVQITLVSGISIIQNNESMEITDEYTCVRDTMTKWYIPVFTSEFDVNKLSECIEIIYGNIANTSAFDAGKLGELFRAKEKSDREFLIKKDFGSLDVIEDAYYKNAIKNNFIEAIKKIVPEYSVDNIAVNFDNFNDVKTIGQVIEFLKEINTNIEEIKEAGFVYTIDVAQYHKRQLKEFIQSEKRHFKDTLFNRAKENESLQKDFLKTIVEFEHFAESMECENSIYFDVKKAVIKEFGEWQSIKSHSSADEEYSSNYEKMNPNKLFEDEISNNSSAQTMIYFRRLTEFEEWLSNMKEKKESENENSEDDKYAAFREMIPNKTEIKYHEVKANEFIGTTSSDKQQFHKNGVYTHSADEKRHQNQKVAGNKGELAVYNLLCQQFGEKNVFPHSEAFVEIGILKPGQAVSGDYDISYKDENGNEFFVEVKAGDRNSFYITPSELDFAKKNASQYKLFLVYNLDKNPPDYIELPEKFWEDKKFRKKEVVERIEFEF